MKIILVLKNGFILLHVLKFVFSVLNHFQFITTVDVEFNDTLDFRGILNSEAVLLLSLV